MHFFERFAKDHFNIKLRKVSIIIISIVGGNWEWRLGADEHSIMGGKIAITCVSLITSTIILYYTVLVEDHL